MKFNWDIVGHQKQQAYLQKQIISGKIGHAYLFVGPSNLGISEVGYYFSQTLLCEGENKPCGRCRNCRQIKKGVYADIIYVAPLQKKNIIISQIRELRKKFSVRSWNSNWQIAIIERAETMTLEAANALLKTLEEPANQQIIILLATDTKFLPKTIISRCQIIKFLPILKTEMNEYLSSKLEDQEQISLIMQLANGYPEIAMNYVKNPKKIITYQKMVEKYLKMFSFKKIVDRIAALENFVSNNELLFAFLEISLVVWRDILLQKNNKPHLKINKSWLQEIEKLAEKYSSKQILTIIEKFNKIKNNRTNLNLKLSMEDLIINYSN